MFDPLPSGHTFLQRLASAGHTREAAWRLLYERYWDYIISVAHKYGHDQDRAEQVLQETMTRLLTKLPQIRANYPQRGRFRNFVYGMARNVALEEAKRWGQTLRRQQSLQEPSREGHDAYGSGDTAEAQLAGGDMGDELRASEENHFEQTILRRALGAAKTQINPATWQAFEAYVIKEEHPHTVADRYGVTVENVYQIKNRVTKLVRREAQMLRDEWVD